jgi:outer membrane protein insertion porin family
MFSKLGALFLLFLPAVAFAQEGSVPITEPIEVEVHGEMRYDLDGISVADVSWSGANVTRDFIIARELHVREGEPFDAATLLADVRRLENLGVFARIDVTTKRGPDGVLVHYDFREMPSYIPYLAFAFTEENGWSVGPALSSVNLFGRSISVAGRVLFGGTNSFNLDAAHPWIGGNHVSLDLKSYYLTRDDTIRDFEEKSAEVTPWVGRFIGRNGRMASTFAYFRMQSDKPWITLTPGGADQWLRLGFRIGYDSRDSWIVPHRGWWTELEIMQNGGFMGGDADYTATTLDIRRFQPLGDATLAVGSLLTMQSGVLGEDVPVYMDFTMGGANTIRGYDFEKLGTELFGKHQLIVTAEYRYPILPAREIPILNWAFRIGIDAAVFVDTGSAWSTAEQFTGDRFRTGGGFGLRFVGLANEMVRLDFGFGDEIFIFHFGSWSKFTAQRNRLR